MQLPSRLDLLTYATRNGQEMDEWTAMLHSLLWRGYSIVDDTITNTMEMVSVMTMKLDKISTSQAVVMCNVHPQSIPRLQPQETKISECHSGRKVCMLL